MAAGQRSRESIFRGWRLASALANINAGWLARRHRRIIKLKPGLGEHMAAAKTAAHENDGLVAMYEAMKASVFNGAKTARRKTAGGISGSNESCAASTAKTGSAGWAQKKESGEAANDCILLRRLNA
jgi:hypothetical protein